MPRHRAAPSPGGRRLAPRRSPALALVALALASLAGVSAPSVGRAAEVRTAAGTRAFLFGLSAFGIDPGFMGTVGVRYYAADGWAIRPSATGHWRSTRVGETSRSDDFRLAEGAGNDTLSSDSEVGDSWDDSGGYQLSLLVERHVRVGGAVAAYVGLGGGYYFEDSNSSDLSTGHGTGYNRADSTVAWRVSTSRSSGAQVLAAVGSEWALSRVVSVAGEWQLEYAMGTYTFRRQERQIWGEETRDWEDSRRGPQHSFQVSRAALFLSIGF